MKYDPMHCWEHHSMDARASVLAMRWRDISCSEIFIESESWAENIEYPQSNRIPWFKSMCIGFDSCAGDSHLLEKKNVLAISFDQRKCRSNEWHVQSLFWLKMAKCRQWKRESNKFRCEINCKLETYKTFRKICNRCILRLSIVPFVEWASRSRKRSTRTRESKHFRIQQSVSRQQTQSNHQFLPYFYWCNFGGNNELAGTRRLITDMIVSMHFPHKS